MNESKTALQEEIMLYRLREVQLKQSGGRYIVSIDREPDAGGSYVNTLEAWTRFIDTVDCRVRRRIGDLLEKQGKNRYTGL